MWDNFKQPNVWLVAVLQKGGEREKIFEQISVKNFQI